MLKVLLVSRPLLVFPNSLVPRLYFDDFSCVADVALERVWVKKPGEENTIKSKAQTKTGFSFGNFCRKFTSAVEMLPEIFKMPRTFQCIMALGVLM